MILEEQDTTNRFLEGRQIADMICDNVKISGTGEALLDFNGLLRVRDVKPPSNNLGTSMRG